jgi:hypothetical protein
LLNVEWAVFKLYSELEHVSSRHGLLDIF